MSLLNGIRAGRPASRDADSHLRWVVQLPVWRFGWCCRGLQSEHIRHCFLFKQQNLKMCFWVKRELSGACLDRRLRARLYLLRTGPRAVPPDPLWRLQKDGVSTFYPNCNRLRPGAVTSLARCCAPTKTRWERVCAQRAAVLVPPAQPCRARRLDPQTRSASPSPSHSLSFCESLSLSLSLHHYVEQHNGLFRARLSDLAEEDSRRRGGRHRHGSDPHHRDSPAGPDLRD